MNIVESIIKQKLVAISRKVAVEDIVPTARALYEGGIRSLEITFNQASPTCIEDTANSIRMVKEAMGNAMCIGAGTVLTIEQVEAAARTGADFVLSPNTDVEIIMAIKKHQMVAIPGALTPSEIILASKSGADIVKLFPAANFGLSYLKAIQGPINHVPLMAVGGVDVHNIKEFLQAGFCSCGIGSNIVRNDVIAEKNFSAITKLAEEYCKAIQ